jgi:hypothetical protein
MTFLIKIKYTTNNIVAKVFNAIEQNFSHFDEWVLETQEFEEIFRTSFNDFFYEFMDELIEEHIEALGTNLHFLIIAYIGSHNSATLTQIKKFVKLYIELILQKDSIWSQGLKYNMEDDYVSTLD